MDKDKNKLLRKIKALAEQGVGGEKSGAERILSKLLKKYNLSEADLIAEEDTISEIEITFKGKEEETLLLQVCYKVFGSTANVSGKVFRYTRGKGSRNTKIINCTPSEAAQIILYFDFYKDLWKKEKAKLLEAFIQKNKIFGNDKPSNSERLSDEEIEEILKRMSILDEAEIPSLRIESERRL